MGPHWLRNSVVYLVIVVAVISIILVFFRPANGESDNDGSLDVIFAFFPVFLFLALVAVMLIRNRRL